jgi:hypothetical protein
MTLGGARARVRARRLPNAITIDILMLVPVLKRARELARAR